MSISMEQMEEVLESFNDHNVERIVSHFEEEGEFLMAAGPGVHTVSDSLAEKRSVRFCGNVLRRCQTSAGRVSKPGSAVTAP